MNILCIKEAAHAQNQTFTHTHNYFERNVFYFSSKRWREIRQWNSKIAKGYVYIIRILLEKHSSRNVLDCDGKGWEQKTA